MSTKFDPQSSSLKNTEKLQKLHEIAKLNSGKCLAESYVNAHAKLKWECSLGHIWEANANNVQNGTWCPTCSRKNRKKTPRVLSVNTIQKNETRLLAIFSRMQEIARERGGECLSSSVSRSTVKLSWKCALGHQWDATPNNIANGTWCPRCAIATNSRRQQRTIVDLKTYATAMGGQCLSDTLLSPTAKVRWKCNLGHEWGATPQSVIGAKNWCPRCGKDQNDKRLDEMRPAKLDALKKIAIERGGECLSDTYLKQHSHLNWRCGNGHEWSAKPASILQGTWCPVCSARMGERICREFFEQLFQTEFPKVKPEWLRSEAGTLLELDGYSETLSIAFEHHGTYHYEIVPPFSPTLAALKKRQATDELKKTICKANGVALIEIPEVPTLTSIENLKSLIINECSKQHRSIPLAEVEVNLTNAYKPSLPYRELIQIAVENQGELISPSFLGWSTPLLWRCAQSHEWSSSPSSVLHQKSWCPHCAGVVKKTLTNMQELAAARNGRCISTEYLGARVPLRWRCDKGHEWDAAPVNITSRNSWCPYCIGQKGFSASIEFMRETALERGGRCLSIEYKNSKSKLRWQCSVGHEWDAIPLNVIHKRSWCPHCARRGKAPIKTVIDFE